MYPPGPENPSSVMQATRFGPTRLSQWLSHMIVGVIGLIGIVAFLYPFFLPQLPRAQTAETARSGEALLLFALLFVLSLVVLLAEMESHRMNTKMVAVLGVLTATNAVLRLADTAIAFLNIGGFSPVFLLVILCGYVYGSRFGFLLGALTITVSGIITGGVGPWLPYQMFTLGWVGLTAGWLPERWLREEARMRIRASRLSRETAVLALFGGTWGLFYGVIINLYFWPYTVGSAMAWSPGTSIGETLQQYLLFYLATSLWWDGVRAIGNVALILLFGPAILKVLRRFQRRFNFSVGAV